jgi:hypothetical protein
MSRHQKLDESYHAFEPLSHQAINSETMCADLIEIQHYLSCTSLPLLQTTRASVLKRGPRLRFYERIQGIYKAKLLSCILLRSAPDQSHLPSRCRSIG